MSKRRLLLADDSVTIQKVVNLTFADEGVEVITVGDGDAAMLKFAEAAPDLVLADVNMPGLDGYQICEQIKQNAATRKIPVILLVGSFEPFDEEKAKRVGADDFLTKPFQSIRQLVNKVTDLLDAEADDEVFSSLSGDAASLAVNSFDDTLEPLPTGSVDSANVSPVDLGDAGMDDEMIHTAQIGSLPVDEAKKFESEPVVDESFAEDVDRTALKQPYSYESSAGEFAKAEDSGKTQPLNKADLHEISVVPAKAEINKADESPYEFDGRREFAEENVMDDAPPQSNPNENNTAQTFSTLRTTTDLNFEAFDLLEFPQPRKKETFAEIDLSADFQTSNREPNAAAGASEQAFEKSNAAAQTETLSPAMIEAIADRVVEKLSNEVIKRVVSEVLAQMERRK